MQDADEHSYEMNMLTNTDWNKYAEEHSTKVTNTLRNERADEDKYETIFFKCLH